MNSSDPPPRPARAAPARTPVVAGAANNAGVAVGRTQPLATESGTRSTAAADPAAERQAPSGSRPANARKETRARLAGGGAEAQEEKSGAMPRAGVGDAGAESGEKAARLTSPGVPSSLSVPGSLPQSASGSAGTDVAAETALAAKARGEHSGPDTGRGSDVLVSPEADPDMAGNAAAGLAEKTGRRGAHALLRGTHRTVLTAAAVTGVVLVAGVLVGLRGGGASHVKAGPDPAATLLDPGQDGGAQAGVPGALPLPSGQEPGAPPAAGHVDEGKHSESGKAHGGSHGPSSGSSSASQGDAVSGGDSKSPSTSHPTTTQHTAGTAPGAQATAPASTGGSGSKGVMVFSHASGRCLTVAGGKGIDGSPLEIRDCSGSSAQKWTFASDGTIRTFGLCMDAAGASTVNGTVVQLATCNGGPAQQFRLNVRQDLTSVLADKCVDVKDERTANGTRLQLWSCAGTDNQKWSKK